MTYIRILLPDEMPKAEHLCRPLRWDLKHSTCDVNGHPKNHFKWAPASACIPAEYLHNYTVQELAESGYAYEFIDGTPPKSHTLDMRIYPKTPPKLEK